MILNNGYMSVVEHLLSCNVPVPPHILPIALWRHCSPKMIELLVCKGAYDFAIATGFRWDTLLQLVHTSYPGQDRQQVIDIIDAARKTARSSLRDGTSTHVAKRPRLG